MGLAQHLQFFFFGEDGPIGYFIQIAETTNAHALLVKPANPLAWRFWFRDYFFRFHLLLFLSFYKPVKFPFVHNELIWVPLY